MNYQPINPGAVVSAAGYFNKYLGVQAEGSFFPSGPNDCVFTAQAGPIVRYQKNRWVPFAHALVGGAKVGGPSSSPAPGAGESPAASASTTSFPHSTTSSPSAPSRQTLTTPTSTTATPGPGSVSGGTGDIYAYRLSAGIVLRFGQVTPPPPVQRAAPFSLRTPTPVIPSPQPRRRQPRSQKKAAYTWTSTGGQISGTAETANLSTANLSARRLHRHRPRQRRPAPLPAGHLHRQLPHPRLPSRPPSPARPTPAPSCRETPQPSPRSPPARRTARSPTPTRPPRPDLRNHRHRNPKHRGSTIRRHQRHLQRSRRPWQAGHRLHPGHHQRGRLRHRHRRPATSAASPSIATRSVPSASTNEAKGCLDEIALTLNRESSAKLIIIGKHSADESSDAAAQRALNVEQYLIDEKGIDPSRIELRTGADPSRGVDNVLVPTGATFAHGDTTTFDPGSVKRQGQPYGKPKTATRAQ